jgi:hypothetical protein
VSRTGSAMLAKRAAEAARAAVAVTV